MRISGIVFGAVLTLAGLAALLHDGAGRAADARPPARPTSASAINRTARPSDGRQRELPADSGPQPELLPVSDTTGLLESSLTIGELLDRVDSDMGEGFSLLDRGQLAAVLQSDPEIRKAMVD